MEIIIMHDSVTKVNKCLLSTEKFEIGFKPPKYYNELMKNLNEYVTDYINKNSNLVEKLDIKNEASKYEYKLPKYKDKINWKSYYLSIPVISIDLKKQKEFGKYRANDIDLNFEYKFENETFKISNNPYYTNGNKRLTYYLMNTK
jgi:hypothetical protein